MAQDISGTELGTTWKATVAIPKYKVYVDWNDDGDYGDTHEDISDRVEYVRVRRSNYSTVLGLPKLGNIPPAEATIRLSNHDNFLSTDNASGIVGTYSDLGSGIYRLPIKIEAGYENSAGTAELLRQFTGRIEQPNEDEGPQGNTVTFHCKDAGVELSEHKVTTDMLEDKRPDEYMNTILGASYADYSPTSLDTGLTIIPYSWADDEPAYSECQRAAAAEGGQFYINKNGSAVFRRLTSYLERTDSSSAQVTISSGEIERYEDQITARNLYNNVVVGWEARYLGALQSVYTASDILEIEAGGSETYDVRYSYPTYITLSLAHGTDYTAVTSGMQKVDEGTAGVQTTLTSYGQRGSLEITNNMSNQRVYIMDLKIRGVPLISDTANQETFSSTAGLIPGTKTHEIRGNPFIQTQVQAKILGGYMLDRLERPRRVFKWSGVACPYLELGDRVHIDHKTVSPHNPSIDRDCYVLEDQQTLNVNRGVYEQTLTLLPVNNLFPYDDLFIIGSSNYAGTSDKAGY